MLKIISVIWLVIPLIWEILNDKNGDDHNTRGLLARFNIPSKKVDVIVRILLAIILSVCNNYLVDMPIWKSIFLCGAIHFLFFDYIIAYILIKKGIIKGHWYSYMGSKGIDNVKSWKNVHPHVKLIFRLVLFIISFYIYFS